MEVEKIQEKQQTKAIGSLFSKKSAVVKEVNGEEKNSSIDNENGKSPRKGNKNSVASLFAAQADKQKVSQLYLPSFFMDLLFFIKSFLF